MSPVTQGESAVLANQVVIITALQKLLTAHGWPGQQAYAEGPLESRKIDTVRLLENSRGFW